MRAQFNLMLHTRDVLRFTVGVVTHLVLLGAAEFLAIATPYLGTSHATLATMLGIVSHVT